MPSLRAFLLASFAVAGALSGMSSSFSDAPLIVMVISIHITRGISRSMNRKKGERYKTL